MHGGNASSYGSKRPAPAPGSRSGTEDHGAYAHGLAVHPSLTSAACLQQPGAPAPAPQAAASQPGPAPGPGHSPSAAKQGGSARGSRARVRARDGGRVARAPQGAAPRTRTSARIRSRAQQGGARTDAPSGTAEAGNHALQPAADPRTAPPFPMLRPLAAQAGGATAASAAGAYPDFAHGPPSLVGAGPGQVSPEWFASSPALTPSHLSGQTSAAHGPAYAHTEALLTTPVAATHVARAAQQGGHAAAAAHVAHAAPPSPPYAASEAHSQSHTSPALGNLEWPAMSLD